MPVLNCNKTRRKSRILWHIAPIRFPAIAVPTPRIKTGSFHSQNEPESNTGSFGKLRMTESPPADDDFSDLNNFESKRVLQLRRSIRASHIRQMVWIGVAAAQVTALVVLLVIENR